MREGLEEEGGRKNHFDDPHTSAQITQINTQIMQFILDKFKSCLKPKGKINPAIIQSPRASIFPSRIFFMHSEFLKFIFYFEIIVDSYAVVRKNTKRSHVTITHFFPKANILQNYSTISSPGY